MLRGLLHVEETHNQALYGNAITLDDEKASDTKGSRRLVQTLHGSAESKSLQGPGLPALHVMHVVSFNVDWTTEGLRAGEVVCNESRSPPWKLASRKGSRDTEGHPSLRERGSKAAKEFWQPTQDHEHHHAVASVASRCAL